MNSPNQEPTLSRISVWILCTLAFVLWGAASTMGIWFPWFAQNTNTGALDDIIYTFAFMAAVFFWLLALVLSWRRKNLGAVRWLPLGLLAVMIAINGLGLWGQSYETEQVKNAALSGDRVKGYITAESQTKEKVILAYFMDFPGTPPDDKELLKPVTITRMASNYIGTRYGGGGAEQSSASGFYSLNRPKRLRWYIWHIKKHGQLVKGKDGIERFDDTLLVDPKIPVVVCEATVPIYVSPIRDQVELEFNNENSLKPEMDWREGHVNLIATFYNDGRSFTLNAPWGYSPKQQPEYTADILQHQHEGDCK